MAAISGMATTNITPATVISSQRFVVDNNHRDGDMGEG